MQAFQQDCVVKQLQMALRPILAPLEEALNQSNQINAALRQHIAEGCHHPTADSKGQWPGGQIRWPRTASSQRFDPCLASLKTTTVPWRKSWSSYAMSIWNLIPLSPPWISRLPIALVDPRRWPKRTKRQVRVAPSQPPNPAQSSWN